jgi:hypothetical protein
MFPHIMACHGSTLLHSHGLLHAHGLLLYALAWLGLLLKAPVNKGGSNSQTATAFFALDRSTVHCRDSTDSARHKQPIVGSVGTQKLPKQSKQSVEVCLVTTRTLNGLASNVPHISSNASLTTGLYRTGAVVSLATRFPSSSTITMRPDMRLWMWQLR